ncbi:hypothetical protein PLICRDRAFT_139050 [Plicaturopsis crispa FD-325 SS-3]|nr:hypothetical protein PLICRDRAFT_139050 [Plicaturopsis crispa FD-325 SS-3]
MHIKNLRVRPKKSVAPNVCTEELTTMLACWAATGDLKSTKECAEQATALYTCMRTTPFRAKQQRPTINYHLARLQKHLK